MLKQTSDNLYSIFNDTDLLTPEQCKALGIVQQMLRDKIDSIRTIPPYVPHLRKPGQFIEYGTTRLGFMYEAFQTMDNVIHYYYVSNGKEFTYDHA